jgi:ComF family protein
MCFCICGYTALKSLVYRIYSLLLFCIAPPFCASCRIFLSERTVLCAACMALVRPIVSLSLQVTRSATVWVHAFAAYQEPLKPLILAKLYGSPIPARQLGQLMSTMPIIQQAEFDYIVPIPLHWTRLAWRGFNQSQEIAQVLSRTSGKPVAHLLKRVKRTTFQSRLSLQERKENVTAAFALASNAQKYSGKRLLLVDDLYTTGTTVRSACTILRELKPASLQIVVACRVM